MRVTIGPVLRKGLTLFLAVWVFLLGIMTSEGSALLIPSVSGSGGQVSLAQREREVRQIQVLLESRLIAQRLSDLGFTPREVQERLVDLTDAQIHQIAQHLEALQPGGDSALGIIIALLVIAILVFIILQITGHKVIVTK